MSSIKIKYILSYILKYNKIHFPKKTNGRNWIDFPMMAASMKYQNLSLLWRRATVTASGIVGINHTIARINSVRCPCSDASCFLKLVQVL